MTRDSISLLAALAMLALASCGHSSDAQMELTFHNHYQDLTEVVTMLQRDSDISGISDRFLDSGPGQARSIPLLNGSFVSHKGSAPITRQRLERYQDLRRRVGIEGAIFRGGGEIEFDVEPGSMSNGDSRKGFIYLCSPKRLEPLLRSLDGIRKPRSAGPDPYFTYKPLGSGWYLFLMYS